MRLIVAALCLALAPVMLGAQEELTDSSDPRVRVVTSVGDFVIQLNPRRAPMTVEAFLRYVDEGFYEGTIFHRVIAGFLAQTGGFTIDMKAKPVEGHTINESGNGLSNMRGTVGLARANEPHSGSSQFYINLADNLDLNPRPTRWGYAVFGEVVEGMDVVDQIGHSATGAGGDFASNVPVNPITIERIDRLDH